VDFHGLTDKPVIVDADELVIADSEAAFVPKKFTWLDFKAAFKAWWRDEPATLDNKTLLHGQAVDGLFLVDRSAGRTRAGLPGVIPGTTPGSIASAGAGAGGGPIGTPTFTNPLAGLPADALPTVLNASSLPASPPWGTSYTVGNGLLGYHVWTFTDHWIDQGDATVWTPAMVPANPAAPAAGTPGAPLAPATGAPTGPTGVTNPTAAASTKFVTAATSQTTPGNHTLDLRSSGTGLVQANGHQIVTTDTAQALSNKTIDYNLNTIKNLPIPPPLTISNNAVVVFITEALASNAAWVDLATATDHVTVTLGASGVALVMFGAEMQITAGRALLGVSINGTLVQSLHFVVSTFNAGGFRSSGIFLAGPGAEFGNLTPNATVTFKLKYLASGGDAHYGNRSLTVIPF
jgi:hypothetical protein